MNLEKKLNNEVDFDKLKELSSLLSAKRLICKFEKYYGKTPIEYDFYKIYLKYFDYQILNGKVFNSFGIIKKSVLHYLNSNSPKFNLTQFKLLENYLFHKRIIREKIFNE